MKKSILFILFFISVKANAQFNIVPDFSNYKPFTLEQKLAPILLAKQREEERQVREYNNAYEEYTKCYEKYQDCIKKGDLLTARTNVDRMIELNTRYHFASEDAIKQLKSHYNHCVRVTQAFEEFSPLYDRGMKFLKEGQYLFASLDLTDAMRVVIKYKDIFSSTDIPKDLNESIEYCARMQEISQIEDVNNPYQLVTSSAQKPETIRNTYQTCTANKSLKITKISNTTKELVIELEYTNNYDKDGWCNISPSTFILDKRNNKKYVMLYADGIAMEPAKTKFMHKDEKIKFRLVFPALPSQTYFIDLIENDESAWRFYNLKIR